MIFLTDWAGPVQAKSIWCEEAATAVLPVESVLRVGATEETTAIEGNLNGQLGVATRQFLIPQVWAKYLVIPVKNGRKERNFSQ